MRIAIDARMMGAGNTRGIGRYIKETVEAMRGLGRLENQESRITNHDSKFVIHDSAIEFILLQPPIRWYTFAEQVRMPSVLRSANADVVWVPHWNVPLFYFGAPLVVTVHDLLLIHQPASAKASTRGPVVAWLKRLGHRVVLWNALHRAAKILVPTQTVAEDVLEHYSFAKNKIVVTGEGIKEFPIPNIQFPMGEERFGNWKLDIGNFLLYFGSAYPHKRLDLLLEAWSVLSSKHPDLSLVIGGEEDVFMKRVMDEAASMNLPRVHFTGRLSDEALAAHLAEAVLHVHPSSFEGFALPSLEALSLGCPTVVSDIPLMIEVLPKDGVFIFKNGDANAMIATIERVLANVDEAHAAARRGGDEARKRHDWNVVAKKTLDALCLAQAKTNPSEIKEKPFRNGSA